MALWAGRWRPPRSCTMRVAVSLTAVALAIAGTLAGVQLAASGPSRADEVTASQNLSRDDWDSSEPAFSPAVVSSKSFGQIFDTPVNGQVYGQPLSMGNSVLVATEDDYVYSINRNTGAVNWSTQLGTPWETNAGLLAATGHACGSRPPPLPFPRGAR